MIIICIFVTSTYVNINKKVSYFSHFLQLFIKQNQGMKKLLLNTLLLIVASIPCFITATAQTIPALQSSVYVFPDSPSAKDSVTVTLVYVSGDACPDYYLVKDSSLTNRIYVSKRNIEKPANSFCAEVVTKFSATLNLGFLPANTQIYFEGNLIKTIEYPCVMDRKGIVVAGTGDCTGQNYIQETTIYLSAFPRLFALPTSTTIDANGSLVTLKPGDNVRFGGTEIKNDSVPSGSCRIIGVANCYEVISTPPPGCELNKKGIVISGKDGCAGELFIQEYSPVSSSRQLYSIQTNDSVSSNGTPSNGLKEGDQVLFGGYLIKNDSILSGLCHIVGVATCYRVVINPPGCIMDKTGIVVEIKDSNSIIKEISTGDLYAINKVHLNIGSQIKFKGIKIECFTTPCYYIVDCYQVIDVPKCIMNKTGEVVYGIDGCTGKLFIQETTSGSTNSYLYAINDILPLSSGIAHGLKPGDKVLFGGNLLKNDSSMIRLCPVDGIATCYELLTTPPPCTMDKKGIVVSGKNGCTGQLFIQEYSPINSYPQLYIIKGGPILNNSGTHSTLLKEGDIVTFGGYLTLNDSSTTNTCRTVGIATCYQVVSTPPACIMDKTGIVVPGIDGCTGQLFIQYTSGATTYPQLYTFDNPVTANSTISVRLKAGDKVKFGGYLINNDSTYSILCPIAGKATCYELLSSDSIYTLSGSVYAGNSVIKSGTVLLYLKGERKAMATYPVTDGTFAFSNLPKGEYSVYAIPSLNLYTNYLPTFYISNYLFLMADYHALNNSVTDMTVHLMTCEYPVGTGKITGNIFFETYNLKDSLMVENAVTKINNIPKNNSAINTPVILLNYLNDPVAWTLTDIDGNYTFENIALGTYKVVTETASAKGESFVTLTPGNSNANADLILKGLLTDSGTSTAEDIIMSIYPIPVVDNLTLTLKEDAKAEFYNTVGQQLLNLNLKSGNNVVYLGTFNKGIYFVKIGNTIIKVIKK